MRVPVWMQVLLLHSKRAGRGQFTKSDLVRPFVRAGHEVRYQSVHARHWKRRLKTADLVVAVGGDGSVAKVAIAVAKLGRRAPPLAVIPAGKANNIARILGPPASPARFVAGLERAISTRLAIGLIRSPWGKQRFVESAGIGPLSELLRTEVPTLRGALRLLRGAFRDAKLHALRVRAGRRDLSGRYVLLHVMNIDAVGPRLVYAPRANPGDRLLDVVLVPDSKRVPFMRYLDRLASGKKAQCPVQPLRVRQIEIEPWETRDGGHSDDKIWPDERRPKRGRVRIEVETTIRVLVPRA